MKREKVGCVRVCIHRRVEAERESNANAILGGWCARVRARVRVRVPGPRLTRSGKRVLTRA